MCFDVARSRVTDRDRGICVTAFLAKHRGHGFADDVSTSQDDDFRAISLGAGADQQFEDARRCRLKYKWRLMMALQRSPLRTPLQ